MKTLQRTQRLALSLLVMILVAGAAYVTGRWTADTPDSDNGTTDAESAERPVLYWRAPMNPNEIYDAPGTSRMGMDLVPVYADEASGQGVVSIDPVTMQNIGVRTARVVIEPLQHTVRTTGRFTVNEQEVVAVSPKISGWVETLHVNFEGARVKANQPLLEIYSPELVATQEEYLLALRNAERLGISADSDRLIEAARRRLAYWDISDAQVRRLEETGEPTKTLTLYAPADGTVAETNVVEGQRIAAGQTLMKLSNLSSLWLNVDLYEQDLAWVAVGTMASIELPYNPGQTIQARVSFIYDELDTASRTVKARIDIPNPGLRLKPEMYASVRLVGTTATAYPVVPAESVIRTGERDVVIVALGDGRFLPTEVTVGLEADGRIQILDGLSGTEQVVTSGQFLIDSEAQLASAVNAMTQTKGGGQPDVHTVTIDVGKSGAEFEPVNIEVAEGETTRITVTRHSDTACALSVAIPDLGIETTALPMHESVVIDVLAENTGTLSIICDANVLKGTFVASSRTHF